MRLSLPSKLEWRPNMQNVSESHTCLLEILNLDLLHNDFILYSVLIRRTGEHKDRLIQAARKMLSTLVSLVSSRAPSMSTSLQSSWDVCSILNLTSESSFFITYMRLALLHRPPMRRRPSARIAPTLATKTSPTDTLRR